MSSISLWSSKMIKGLPRAGNSICAIGFPNLYVVMAKVSVEYSLVDLILGTSPGRSPVIRLADFSLYGIPGYGFSAEQQRPGQ